MDEILDRMRFTGGDDVIIRLGSLQHEPHCRDIILGVPPIAPRGGVPENQFLLEQQLGEVRTVLAGNPCNERAPGFRHGG